MALRLQTYWQEKILISFLLGTHCVILNVVENTTRPEVTYITGLFKTYKSRQATKTSSLLLPFQWQCKVPLSLAPARLTCHHSCISHRHEVGICAVAGSSHCKPEAVEQPRSARSLPCPSPSLPAGRPPLLLSVPSVKSTRGSDSLPSASLGMPSASTCTRSLSASRGLSKSMSVGGRPPQPAVNCSVSARHHGQPDQVKCGTISGVTNNPSSNWDYA